MTFEDDLLALERRVLEQAGGDFFRAVADLRKRLAADSGGVARLLDQLALPALEGEATLALLDGWEAGGQRALQSARERGVDSNAIDDADLRLYSPPAHLTDPFTGLDALLADAKTRSLALLRSGADDTTAAAPIFQAATTARSRIVTQVNAASNLAAVEVGDATRSPMVWEAERDGCVYCLALAGEVVQKAGDPFPTPDLYAPVPKSMTTTSAPPLHPHCRCRLAVLVSQEYADALKREAQRSILRGHSLASESEAVRVRAAERLLARNPVAPKTVKAFAATAVKRGHFPTREVPKGDPRLIIERAGPKPPPAPSAPPPTSRPPRAPRAPRQPQEPIPGLPDLKRIKPESATTAARKTNPMHPYSFDYRDNCHNVVNAVELRQRGFDVVARPDRQRAGRSLDAIREDWMLPEAGAGHPRFQTAADLGALEQGTAQLPKGARGFVSVVWDSGGAHIFNFEKTGEEGAAGLRFHEGQEEHVTSTKARDYFDHVTAGGVHWMRVDDCRPSIFLKASVEDARPVRDDLEQRARVRAAASPPAS